MSFSNMRDDYIAPEQPVKWNERTLREYWCKNEKNCGNRIQTIGIPPGWYILRHNPGNTDHDKLVTVALVCSLPCLLQDLFNYTIGKIKMLSILKP